MKYPVLISILLAFGIITIGLGGMKSDKFENPTESNGINFYIGRWDEILTRSKKENKKIFLDVSATWCGPCRRLKSFTFKDKDVSRIFNDKFINVNIEEDNPIGEAIYQKYQIESYPTLLFLDSSGNVLSRIIGYIGPNELIRHANKY